MSKHFRWGLALLVIGLVFSGAAALLVLRDVFAPPVALRDEAFTLPFVQGDSLQVSAPHMSVTIAEEDVAEASVRYTVTGAADAAPYLRAVTARTEAGVLLVAVSREFPMPAVSFGGGSVRESLHIALPRGRAGQVIVEGDVVVRGLTCESFTAKDGDVSGGNITAQRLHISVAHNDCILSGLRLQEGVVNASYGSIALTDVQMRALTASSQFGDLRVDGAVQNVQLSASSADVRLRSSVPPEGSVASSFGSVDVEIPPDGGYAITASSRHGFVDVQLPASVQQNLFTVGDGRHRLEMTSQSGDITVRAYK